MTVMDQAVDIAIKNAESIRDVLKLVENLLNATDRAITHAKGVVGTAPNMQCIQDRLDLVRLGLHTANFHAERLLK